MVWGMRVSWAAAHGDSALRLHCRAKGTGRVRNSPAGESGAGPRLTPDAIWRLFFAVNKGFTGSMRNGCLSVVLPGNRVRKFYRFSLSEPMLRRNEAFCDGSV